MLIQRAVLLDGKAVDIRVGPKIVDVADRLVPRPGEDVYDAAGGTVLPGLHDHHLHIRAVCQHNACTMSRGAVASGPAQPE